MGDIIKYVKICGMVPRAGGFDAGTCKRVKALVDSGASATVITSQLEKEINAGRLPTGAVIDARDVPRCLANIKLEAKGCNQRPVMPIVDDTLANKAGNGIQIILGHDYLQADRGAMRYYGKDGRESEVACAVSALKPAKRKRGK